MSPISIGYIALGNICTLMGTGILYFSWKLKPQLKETFTIAGWCLLVTAMLFWIELTGWEFGTIYAFTLPSLAALIYVVFNTEINGSKSQEASFQSISLPARRQLVGFIVRLFLILPFALAASVFVSYGLSIVLVASELNQLVLAICILPVIWGLFAYWLLADTRIVRPIASQLGLSLIFMIPVLQV